MTSSTCRSMGLVEIEWACQLTNAWGRGEQKDCRAGACCSEATTNRRHLMANSRHLANTGSCPSS